MVETAQKPRRRRWPYVLGGIVAVIAVVAILFRWDWLLPIVDSRASAALGRTVTAQHLHVSLGRITRIELDGVRIANPANWPGGGDFATANKLVADVDAMALLRRRQVVLPMIALDTPHIDAEQQANGAATWDFPSSSPTSSTSTSQPPKIGTLVITNGTVKVVDPKLRANLDLAVNTEQPAGGPSRLHATAQGTYAGQPITGTFTGGALLSLRDAAHPYPIDLQLANGPTHIRLTGTVQNPLSFAGANVKLDLAGPDMSKLYPLTGIPIPETPPYHVAGNLDYVASHIRFTGFQGTVGRTDLGGDIAVTTGGTRPVVDATLASRRVDLQDLGGFIGSTPGHSNEAGQTPAERARVAAAERSPKLIPDTPVSLPRLTAADIHLKYHAGSIAGRGVPLDQMTADLDIVDGNINLHPLSFGIGGGRVISQIALSPVAAGLHARANVDFRAIPLDRLLASTGAARGAGAIGGQLVLDGTGRSLAEIVGHGNGEIKLFMGHGGNLSALLVDLAGLEFGNAVLSALGVPTRADIECLVLIAPLHNGVLTVQTFALDTTEANVALGGEVNLMTEAIGLKLSAKSRHFSIGSIPTPILVTGTFKGPSVHPALGPLAARGGVAIGLGIVLTPLAALIPTIQLGTGDNHACAGLGVAEAPPHVPPPVRRAPVRAPVRRVIPRR